MIANIEHIKGITHGALRIWEENGYFHFSRFAPEQDAVLDASENEKRKKHPPE